MRGWKTESVASQSLFSGITTGLKRSGKASAYNAGLIYYATPNSFNKNA
jgi:hypothetical protein